MMNLICVGDDTGKQSDEFEKALKVIGLSADGTN